MGTAIAREALTIYGRAPRNIFERDAARIHQLQPEPLPVVFVVPPSPKSQRRRQYHLRRKELLHLERWEEFRNILRRTYPAIAETTAMYHLIEFWECWLCGFDAYQPVILRWWLSMHFDLRQIVIRASRGAGRDQLSRRKLLKIAMRELNFQNLDIHPKG